MRKINISSQLLVLFFSIILFTSCAFTLITYSCIKNIADKEVFSRLKTYSYLINDENTDNQSISFPDMIVGYYIKDNENIHISDNSSQLINIKELDFILEKTEKKFNNNNKVMVSGFLNSGRDRIYYVLQTENAFESYTFVFTDSTYTNDLVKTVAIQVIIIFFLLILISTFVLYCWSKNFVKRIKNIQYHIMDLPKNKYNSIYVDERLDEIGELSQSIENMRQEIAHHEHTKQEMLQNISHDFKTPIAVIKSYAEAQQDGMADEDSSKIILQQAEILKKKVNKLLQYNSLEYLSKDKEFENVDLFEIITEVLNNYRYETNIKFDLDIQKDCYFKGYRENYYTIIENILDNAKRYAKSTIKIVLRPNRIRIYNDGEHIDKVFINGQFKAYEKGSNGEFGLGMSIVKKTVDFFGLNLKVVNEEYGGVSFIITNEK